MNKDLWWIVSGASSGQPRTEVFHSGSSSFSVGPEPPGDTDLAEACVVKVGEGKVRSMLSRTESFKNEKNLNDFFRLFTIYLGSCMYCFYLLPYISEKN